MLRSLAHRPKPWEDCDVGTWYRGVGLYLPPPFSPVLQETARGGIFERRHEASPAARRESRQNGCSGFARRTPALGRPRGRLLWERGNEPEDAADRQRNKEGAYPSAYRRNQRRRWSGSPPEGHAGDVGHPGDRVLRFLHRRGRRVGAQRAGPRSLCLRSRRWAARLRGQLGR
jgi:hypothetical protein